MVMGELEQETQVAVIGGGPAGYAAAFRAADLGLEVSLVDPSPRPGGVCLYEGCIPSKALLWMSELIYDAGRAADIGVTFGAPRIDLTALRRWKNRVIDTLADGLAQLCRQRGVQQLQARASFEDAHHIRLEGGDIRRLRFQQAVIATGSRPVALPNVAPLPQGRIMDAAGALALADLPKRLLVVGGGYVGLELGSVYAALGSKIELVEASGRLLAGVDDDLVAPLKKRLENSFESVTFHTRITAMEERGDEVEVTFSDRKRPPQRYDRVLLAIGRMPASDDIGLENTAVRVSEEGFIRVDAQQRTVEPTLYAIGDVTGHPMLAHKASREGIVAAEVIAGRPSAFDARAVPTVVYTDPQIACCGLTEARADEEGRKVKIQRFPWRYSGRAASMGVSDGLTKLIVDAESGRVLGAGVSGRQAEGLIAEAVLAIEMGALAEDIALSIHPHPTLSETEAEAAALFTGAATHLSASR
ncbi:MAG: dihydrolipoyl dehydrogenase [Desulfosarcinaceae bacterium]|jgi:dihydrolipoamide dehydrogenase